jgi:hypothetical protein
VLCSLFLVPIAGVLCLTARVSTSLRALFLGSVALIASLFVTRALIPLTLACPVLIETAELAGLVAIIATNLRGPIDVDLALLIGRIVVTRTRLGGLVDAHATLLDCCVRVLALCERCAERSSAHQ